jgi:hypothetical protein
VKQTIRIVWDVESYRIFATRAPMNDFPVPVLVSADQMLGERVGLLKIED